MPTRTLSARAAVPLMAIALALGSATATVCVLSVSAAAAGAGGAPEVSATVSPAQLQIGTTATISGHVALAGRPLAGAQVALQSEPYPFRSFAVVAHAHSAADGSFTFTRIELDANARLRVLDEDAPGAFSETLSVIVDPAVAVGARELAPGRTRLSVRIRHLLGAPARPFTVMWYTAPRGQRRFQLTATSTSRELAAGLSYAAATVDPPARRFVFRVCMNPPWEAAMGPASAHGNCPQHDFTVPSGAH